MSQPELDNQPQPRTPLEYIDAGGLALEELGEPDSAEVFRLFETNKESFKMIAGLKHMDTEADVLEMLTNPEFFTFGIRPEVGKELAGILTFAQEAEDRVSIGFAVSDRYRRQGVATRAVNLITPILLRIPNMNTVRAYVRPDNFASRALLQKCGYRLRGERPHVHVFYDFEKPTTGAV